MIFMSEWFTVSALLAMENTGIAMLLGVVILCAVMLRITYRKQRGPRKEAGSLTLEKIAQAKQAHGMKGEMEELMVQLQELSREISAQIDTRFAKLESSIRSADERIEQLRRLQGVADAKPTIDTLVGDDDPEKPPTASSHATESRKSQHGRVFALSDAGKNAVQIAQETGQSPGEIELILALRAHQS